MPLMTLPSVSWRLNAITAVTTALDAAAGELAELRGLRSGRVRLVGFPSASPTIIPRLLADIGVRHSGISVTYIEAEPPEAVEAVMADTSWFSRGLIEKLANLRRPGADHKDGIVPNVSVRERQILDLICQGLGDDAIAKRLNLSRNTVRNHVALIYSKIGVNRRNAAAAWARARGFDGESVTISHDRGTPSLETAS